MPFFVLILTISKIIYISRIETRITVHKLEQVLTSSIQYYKNHIKLTYQLHLSHIQCITKMLHKTQSTCGFNYSSYFFEPIIVYIELSESVEQQLSNSSTFAQIGEKLMMIYTSSSILYYSLFILAQSSIIPLSVSLSFVSFLLR